MASAKGNIPARSRREARSMKRRLTEWRSVWRCRAAGAMTSAIDTATSTVAARCSSCWGAESLSWNVSSNTAISWKPKSAWIPGSTMRHSSRMKPAAASSEIGSRSIRLAEGLDPGLRPAEDQGVDVVRALVGIDNFEIYHMADHAELVRDAVAAQHVARRARDVQRLAAGVALHDRGDLGRGRALVLHAPQAQAALQAERDLGLHVGELLLHQLVGGERPAELLAVQDIASCSKPTIFSGAEGTPGDAVARRVQAGERPFQALHLGKRVLLR